jgi:3-isopropylmalate/(R)-2-methylmalate dehydratase small subunit
MKAFNTLHGKVIPLALKDVDTDMIIPAQYLTSTEVGGYGKGLFARLKQSDADFVFNQSQYADAHILIAKTNFGCGSSREHAVWALLDAGIQVIIAPSFSDIFFNNSAKNGLLLIELPEETVHALLQNAKTKPVYLDIDLAGQTVSHPTLGFWHFEYDPFQKHCLQNGLDQMDYLCSHQQEIDQFFKEGR